MINARRATNIWSVMPMKWNRVPLKIALLMEYDPHQLIEGMILSAYCIGADLSYIFIRGEYVVAIDRLRQGFKRVLRQRLPW